MTNAYNDRIPAFPTAPDAGTLNRPVLTQRTAEFNMKQTTNTEKGYNSSLFKSRTEPSTVFPSIPDFNEKQTPIAEAQSLQESAFKQPKVKQADAEKAPADISVSNVSAKQTPQPKRSDYFTRGGENSTPAASSNVSSPKVLGTQPKVTIGEKQRQPSDVTVTSESRPNIRSSRMESERTVAPKKINTEAASQRVPMDIKTDTLSAHKAPMGKQNQMSADRVPQDVTSQSVDVKQSQVTNTASAPSPRTPQAINSVPEARKRAAPDLTAPNAQMRRPESNLETPGSVGSFTGKASPKDAEHKTPKTLRLEGELTLVTSGGQVLGKGSLNNVVGRQNG